MPRGLRPFPWPRSWAMDRDGFSPIGELRVMLPCPDTHPPTPQGEEEPPRSGQRLDPVQSGTCWDAQPPWGYQGETEARKARQRYPAPGSILLPEGHGARLQGPHPALQGEPGLGVLPGSQVEDGGPGLGRPDLQPRWILPSLWEHPWVLAPRADAGIRPGFSSRLLPRPSPCRPHGDSSPCSLWGRGTPRK